MPKENIMAAKTKIIHAKRVSSLALTLMCLLTACGEGPFFEANETITGSAWKITDKKKFPVKINDTLNYFDFYIDFRHGKSYPYENIYFFMEIEMPGRGSVTDTVGYYMKTPDNNWLGQHTGSLISHHVLVKQRIRFPVKGTYRFILQHGMYDDPLQDISDIGITISRNKK